MSDKKKEKGLPAKPLKRPQMHLPKSMEPVYSNMVRISHTPAEMIFDFGQMLPGAAKAPVKSRVLMTPLSAKLLQRALAENLKKYESMFGEIQLPQGKTLADNLFGSLNKPDKPDKPDKPSKDDK